eukprot:1517980-Pleurochrysis_carterae.AAC.1
MHIKPPATRTSTHAPSGKQLKTVLPSDSMSICDKQRTRTLSRRPGPHRLEASYGQVRPAKPSWPHANALRFAPERAVCALHIRVGQILAQ